MIHTVEAARDALRSALGDVDNQVAAARALLSVVGKCRLPARTSWDAFQLAAEKLLEPWFKDTTQAAVWAVVDQYRNRLAADPDQGSSEDDGAGNSGARVRCMADVGPEDVAWLWASRIPRGKLAEIVGDPGIGKSWLTTEIVACLTTGCPLPGDEFGGEYEPISVLLLSAED